MADHHPASHQGAAVCAAQAFRFERRLTLEAAVLTADYRVTNLSALALPYLWWQHALLATMPGDEL